MKRKTVQRDAIKEVFLQENRPLRVDEILQEGRGTVGSLNQATVYRNLKRLVEEGWLRIVNHPELGTLYERAEKAHHHLFHCHACDRLYEVPGCALKEKRATPRGFIVEWHEVFFSGLCASCHRGEAKT